MQTAHNWRTLSISFGMLLTLLLAACGASSSHGTSSTGSAPAHNPPDGTLFVVSSGASTTGGSSTTTLTAINPATGANQWQANINTNVYNWASVTQGVIIVPFTASQGGFITHLAGYDAGTGKQLWQTPALPARTFIAHLASGTGVVAYGEESPSNSSLSALDAKTGKQLWQTALPTFPIKGAVPSPGFPPSTYTAYVTTLLAADGLVLMGFNTAAIGDSLMPFQSGIIAYNAQTGGESVVRVFQHNRT